MTEKLNPFWHGRRKETDGRGNVVLYTPNCHHYEAVPLVDASDEIRLLIYYALSEGEVEVPPDTPAMREAMRTLIGWGDNTEGQLCAAVCHDPQCYPDGWSNRQIASCEVFVHEVITRPVDDEKLTITATTVAGPRAHCRKVCYHTTPHFYDIEVLSEGLHTRIGKPTHHIVLRCENCHHGYDLVTPKSSPSRWRRLMKNPTARKLLAGTVPDREPWWYEESA